MSEHYRHNEGAERYVNGKTWSEGIKILSSLLKTVLKNSPLDIPTGFIPPHQHFLHNSNCKIFLLLFFSSFLKVSG
jgi:hypothetical protein